MGSLKKKQQQEKLYIDKCYCFLFICRPISRKLTNSLGTQATSGMFINKKYIECTQSQSDTQQTPLHQRSGRLHNITSILQFEYDFHMTFSAEWEKQ